MLSIACYVVAGFVTIWTIIETRRLTVGTRNDIQADNTA